MSNVAPILKALTKQARVNSQLISAMGVLAKSTNLGPEFDKFFEALLAAHDNNKEFIELLGTEVDKMNEGTNV